MTLSNTDWTLTLASGGKPVLSENSSSTASIFSQDGRHCIVIFSHQIRVYFISTRQCIKTIDYDMSKVVDYRLDSLNGNCVLLFKENGEIVTVNWKDKVNKPILASTKIKLELPILSVAYILNDSYYIILGRKEKKATSPHTRYIYRVDRSTYEVQKLLEVNGVIKYACSLDYKKYAFITDIHEAVLVDLTKVYKYFSACEKDSGSENFSIDLLEIDQEVIAFAYKSPVLSLAISNDSIVAIGTAAGTIQILYGGVINDKPQRLLKWHIDQVRSLSFTADSSYLLSGGMEKVLVLWQLETDKTQFLPRLNGSIEKISIDNNKCEYYSLMLRISENDKNSFECLVVSAVDLISRLSISSIRPNFANDLSSTLSKTKKKYLKSESEFDVTKLKHDYSSVVEVHPKTNHLYFPNDATIQAYDLIKNEQVFVQNAAPVLSTGKVRSESKLLDPVVSLLSFSQDGEWMCTFDSISTSEVDNLLSKNDKQFALKFWKFIDSSNKNDTALNALNNRLGYWELSTKIIDPHGASSPVLAIKAAPSSYNKGLGFVTADCKGGLRIWTPRFLKEERQLPNSNGKPQQTAWTLRKVKPCGALESDAIDICWSQDGSVIIVGHEHSLSAINTATLEEIPDNIFKIPSISGSRIRSLQLIGSDLIVLSKTRITSYNLLTNQLNELAAKVNTTIGGKNMIAIDPFRKLVCLAINFYDTLNGGFKVKSKILVFKPNQLKPIVSKYHHEGISSIRYFNSSFIFVDFESRVGILRNSSIDGKNEQFSLEDDMSNMLINAQATADILNNTDLSSKNPGITENSSDDFLEHSKVIGSNTFRPLFENIDGLTLETIFDRVIKAMR